MRLLPFGRNDVRFVISRRKQSVFEELTEPIRKVQLSSELMIPTKSFYDVCKIIILKCRSNMTN